MQHSAPNLTELVMGLGEDLNDYRSVPPKKPKSKSKKSDFGMWTIDTDVPLPEPSSGNKAHYPWKDLEVGHSWWMPGKKKITVRSITVDGKKRNFISKHRQENGVWGVRVWRVK